MEYEKLLSHLEDALDTRLLGQWVVDGAPNLGILQWSREQRQKKRSEHNIAIYIQPSVTALHLMPSVGREDRGTDWITLPIETMPSPSQQVFRIDERADIRPYGPQGVDAAASALSHDGFTPRFIDVCSPVVYDDQTAIILWVSNDWTSKDGNLDGVRFGNQGKDIARHYRGPFMCSISARVTIP